MDYRELIDQEKIRGIESELKYYEVPLKENTQYLLGLITQLCIVIQAKDMKIHGLEKL